MRRFFYLLAMALVCSASLKAAPGDTTWVQAHNTVQMPNFGNYDTAVRFPDGSKQYRKIIMVFTLGKYVCPAGSTYCADWDYTVSTLLMNPAGDTLELGRLISPYANITYARFPSGWKQEYIFDVTDFYPALKDTGLVRINYSGYSGGFTANVRFAFVEGTPERNVLGIDRMWHGSFNYGNTTDPIASHLPVTTLTAPSGTQSAAYKLNITGHGSDATGCSEFCKKYYRVSKDGALVKQTDIWRDNCGFNDLYPQSGTWTFDRGNWCPGASVQTNIHTLPSMSGASAFDLGLELESYATPGAGGAIYIIDGAVVYYGNFNKATDASLEDILAPSDHANNFRENPRAGLTTIRVRNTGAATITSLDFEYGVTGKPATTYKWTGSLAPLTDTVLDLPTASSFSDATGTGNPYTVRITAVNGAADDDVTNDVFKTTFTAAPIMPSPFYVNLRTNKSVTGSGFSETEWRIYTSTGTLVASRVNNSASGVYADTVTLGPGLYKMVVSDAGCDGVSYWLYASYPVNPGKGSIEMRKDMFTVQPMTGYFGGDFGCGFTQYFKIAGTVSINELHAEEGMLDVYPNPAGNEVNVRLDGVRNVDGKLRLVDYTGKVILQQEMHSGTAVLNTAAFSNGLYFVEYLPARADEPKVQTKLVIIK